MQPACEVVEEALDDMDNLLWDPVGLGDGKRLSWRTLSKAFSKYTKLLYSCLCNSVHCSMMFLRVFICSMHPFPFKNPLARWIMIFARILLGTDNREMPLQLLQ